MKTIQSLVLLAAFAAQIPLMSAEPAADPQATPEGKATAVVNQDTALNPDNGTNGLRLNFRGVPLDMVLNYLSEAAGFIINIKPGTSARGKVDVWSNQSLTREEALNLLDTVLNQNGLAAIRNGRTLTIVNRDEAKTHDIPVHLESDPAKIPRNDEIVTQIIPVRFVEVGQLIKDLQPLVSTQTTMTANEAGNAIVITDTQANIRRVAEIIQDIDMGAEAVTQVRVFRLTNADPGETADLLSNLFPDDSKSGSGGQSPIFGAFASRFGRFGGGPPGGGGGGGGGGGSGGDTNQRIKKRARVIAVADQRTSSIVVSAAKELMEQIEGVITELDSNPKGKQTVRMYQFQNADPQEALQVLQDIFQKNGTANTRNSSAQNDPLVSRSTTQNQQNNSANRTGTGTSSGTRGATGGTSF